MSTNARQAKASKLALGTTSRRCSRKYSSYSVARDALDSRVRRLHQLWVHRDTAPVKAGQLSQRNSTFLCNIRTSRRFMTRQSWRDSLKRILTRSHHEVWVSLTVHDSRELYMGKQCD